MPEPAAPVIEIKLRQVAQSILVHARGDEDLAGGAVEHDIPVDEPHRRAEFQVRGLPKIFENSC